MCSKPQSRFNQECAALEVTAAESLPTVPEGEEASDVEYGGWSLGGDAEVEAQQLAHRVEIEVYYEHRWSPLTRRIRYSLPHSYRLEGGLRLIGQRLDPRDGDRHVVERALDLASGAWHYQVAKARRTGDHSRVAYLRGE